MLEVLYNQAQGRGQPAQAHKRPHPLPHTHTKKPLKFNNMHAHSLDPQALKLKIIYLRIIR